MLQLAITPSGMLRCVDSPMAAIGDDALLKRLAVTMAAEGQGAALFSLGALKPSSALHPTVAYWHDFASRYVIELCHTPEAADVLDPIEPLPTSELSRFYLSLPPMLGAEYVSVATLAALWDEMDAWVGRTVAEAGGLSLFMAAYAPHWHQVGRVCFHLAENKADPEYPFAFMATYASGLTKAGRIRYLPLAKALQEHAGAKNKKGLIKLLTPVSSAAKKSSFIKTLLDNGDIYHPFPLMPDEAYSFLTEAPLYEEAGLLVRLPNWWRKRPRPKASIEIGKGKVKDRLGADALLSFDLSVAVGDEQLSAAELEALLAQGDGLQLVKGQWVEVDRERLEEVLDHWRCVQADVGDGIGFINGMRLLAGASADLQPVENEGSLADWSAVHAGPWLRETLAALRDPAAAEARHPGKTLHATLRHYQADGVNWLWFLQELGLGACLADDMGLGKTIQVISLLLILKKQKAGPSLLVVPASLLANWQQEIVRFAPSLRCLFLHSSQMKREVLATYNETLKHEASAYDAIFTTYAMASRLEGLCDATWRLVILDEAQAIKNPGSKQTKAIKKIPARSRIAMTGTPVENRLGDLWSLFDFLNPGLLGTAGRFKSFIKHLEKREHVSYSPLRNLVSPYILRRLKTDKTIISDLPDKTEVRAYCHLSKPQATLYQRCVKEMARTIEQAEGMERRGMVLKYLMRFKQICNHPDQLTGEGGYAPEQSGKFARLKELCDEIASRQEKMLVFTQFREMTAPLADFLTASFGRRGLVLHGGTPVKQRKGLVDQFQAEDGPPFFVLSLKAGGTGLTLTAANHVVHFDRWWNPAVENQATDRAFRIGQKRNVLVHKFVVQGTLEEKIDALIEQKTQLADEVLAGGGEMPLTEMSDEALLELVALDVG